jgi:hypothetical protein
VAGQFRRGDAEQADVGGEVGAGDGVTIQGAGSLADDCGRGAASIIAPGFLHIGDL